MINYVNKALFEQSSVDKQFLIENDNQSISITNADLFNQEFSLRESLCSESELQFGKCEAAEIEFTVANTFGTLKDEWLNLTIVLDNDTEHPFSVGRYKVFSDKPTSRKARRQVVAYDALYGVLDEDYSEWYANLWDSTTTQMSLKDFRDAFFTYVGITQETTTLINDSFIIHNAEQSGETLSGSTILKSICELNGVFGHMGRDGYFHYVSLDNRTATTIDNSQQAETDYEEYTVKSIDSIVMYSATGSYLTTVGTAINPNTYTIQGNILLYGQDAAQAGIAGTNLLSKIGGITYRAFSGTFRGNPCYEVGDRIKFSDRTTNITSFILERRLTGIQSLMDDYSASGTERYVVNANSEKATRNSILRQINDIKSGNSTMQTYIMRNYESIVIADQEEKSLIEYEFVTVDTSAVTFDIHVDLSVVTDDSTSTDYDVFDDATCRISYILDNIDLGLHPKETWQDGHHVLVLHLAFASIDMARHEFTINMYVEGGTVTIPIEGVCVIMQGNGLLDNRGWNGVIEAEDTVGLTAIGG